MWKLHEIQISVSINFYWNIDMLIHFQCIIYIYIHLMAELSSCNREEMAWKA